MLADLHAPQEGAGRRAPAERLRDDGLDVQTEVRTGVADAILDAAEDERPAMLAIATHERTGLERVLMGSVSERVVRQAPCPVFTVKPVGASGRQTGDDRS